MSIDQFRISTPESPSSKACCGEATARLAVIENLQRKGGFKGFNQHAVSIITAETDRGSSRGTDVAAVGSLRLRKERCYLR